MQCEKCGRKIYANEKCVCGQRAPKKNNGKVFVNSLICFILLLIAIFSLVLTLCLRNVVNNNLLVKSIEEVPLAEIEVDDGKKLDQYVYDEFVDDPRISVENVDNLLESPFIKDFLIKKVQAYQDFGLGIGDAPSVNSDEIINLIEDNTELLFNEAGLNFLEPDKAELRDDLSEFDSVCESLNKFLDTAVGARFYQTFFSFANVIFLIILIAEIFLQWLIVYKVNNRRAAKMLVMYGTAVIIPSAFLLLLSLSIKINKDNEIIDKFMGSALTPFIIYPIMPLVCGILLLSAGIIFNKKYKKSKISSVIKNVEPEPINTTTDNTVNEEINIPTAGKLINSETEVMPDPIPMNEKNNVCPNCSHENKDVASFCSRCGTKLK